MTASAYVPTRTEILAARGLETVLQRRGRPVPADIAREAAWDLDNALDTPKPSAKLA